jgi:hypothetical protein
MSIAKRALSIMAWGSDFDSCSTGTGVLQPTPFRLTFMFAVHARAAGEERGDLRNGSGLDARDGKDYILFLYAPSG